MRFVYFVGNRPNCDIGGIVDMPLTEFCQKYNGRHNFLTSPNLSTINHDKMIDKSFD